MSSAPLSYEIREHINMPDKPDPPFYVPLSRYVAFDAKMVRPFSTPHSWPTCRVKGQKFAKARNGRA